MQNTGNENTSPTTNARDETTSPTTNTIIIRSNGAYMYRVGTLGVFAIGVYKFFCI